ncbi:MAG: hypothetical protein ACRD27_06560 [Terracidiphilus sp.]
MRLSSWKEIAAYLDRDPRTVQLWEKHEGLPVHRLTHLARASVYAFTGEIDEWVRARSGEASGPAVEALKPANGMAPQRKNHREWHYAAAGAAILAAAAGAVIWLRPVSRRKTPEPPPAAVLAVLPFTNQTSTDDFLADGLTDGLIADIGRIGKMQVISSASVMPFKTQHLPLPRIAAALHATLALEGTVAQDGSRTLVTVELLDAQKNSHLWGATYARKTGDILGLQDAIAGEIAIAVTRQVTGTAPHIVFPAQSVDPRARQAYLTGRYYWNRRDLADMQKAIALFGKAIAIDPKYDSAYSGLAESYDLMTDRGVLSDSEAFQRAEAAAETALSLDPGSAEAYNALAFATYRRDWDFARADQYFQKAVALNPNYAVAHQWYGEFLGDMRRFDQSIAELRMAKQLDPLSPMVGTDLADGYLHAGRLREADAELKRVLELYPDFVPAHMYRIAVCVKRADFAGAETEARIYQKKTGDETPLQVVEIQQLAAADEVSQARDEARRLLRGPDGAAFNAYRVAQLYFITGENDAGYAALEKAYREHSWWLVTMLVDPGFGLVRNQQRFRDVARRVGLPVGAASAGTAESRGAAN